MHPRPENRNNIIYRRHSQFASSQQVLNSQFADSLSSDKIREAYEFHEFRLPNTELDNNTYLTFNHHQQPNNEILKIGTNGSILAFSAFDVTERNKTNDAILSEAVRLFVKSYVESNAFIPAVT